MKNLFLFFFIVSLASCKKETSNASNQVIAAQKITNAAYGTDTEQKMDLYLPAGRSTDSTKLIVLIHGGAWVAGDKADFATYITTLQQHLPHYAIANINYHLATTTTHHFPTQENDMKAAIGFLVQKSADYHISQSFVLLGASAGGHLALLQAYKYNTPKIKAVVDFFGPANMVDLYNNTTIAFNKSVIEMLMNGTPVTNPSLYQQSSPVNFVTSQAPPTIMLHGDADALVNVNQAINLKEKLQNAGVTNQLIIYPNQGHDLWPVSIMNDAFTKIELFIKANVK